jgi:hypothetical protein
VPVGLEWISLVRGLWPMGVEICRGRVSEQRDRREDALHLEKRERCWFQDNASTQLAKGCPGGVGWGVLEKR